MASPSAPQPVRAGSPPESKEQVEIRLLQLHAESELQRREARNSYGRKFFLLCCVWLGLVLAVVIGSGLSYLRLSDAVLVAALTTTTANILVTLVIVAKYLFPSSGSK